MPLPLTGRTALVTGVSRRRGIGFAVAARLAAMGASLVVHHHRAHDVDEYGTTDDLDDLTAAAVDRHWAVNTRATLQGRLAGSTSSVADHLVEKGILLNTINPGPVNNGYLDDAPEAILERFPQHRLGEAEDPARLIAWLVSDEGEWMAGQVLSSKGGFRR